MPRARGRVSSSALAALATLAVALPGCTVDGSVGDDFDLGGDAAGTAGRGALPTGVATEGESGAASSGLPSELQAGAAGDELGAAGGGGEPVDDLADDPGMAGGDGASMPVDIADDDATSDSVGGAGQGASMEDPAMAGMIADDMVADDMAADDMAADDMAATDGMEADGGMSSAEDVPDIADCLPVADWDPVWAQFEDEVLLYSNEARAVGWNCDTEGNFGPTEPLENDALLRCAARLHSMDMAVRGFFDHTNPDGDGPGQRLDALMFEGAGWGENIAMGQPTPREVVDGWLESDGHCSNIMSPDLTLLGVGYYEGEPVQPRVPGTFWTQVFGAPPFMFRR